MKRIVLFTGLIALFAGQVTAQSGWVRERGSLYAEGSVAAFASDRYYNLEGDLNVGSTFRSQAIHFYGEYGLGKNLSLLANAPLLKFNAFSTTNTVAGVGDIRLGVKYGLPLPFPIAISIEPEIPTGNGENFAQAREELAPGIREEVNLPISDGEFNVWTTMALSQSTAQGKTYGSLFGAANWRTQGFSHQFRAGMEVGQRLFDRMWLIGRLNVQTRLGGGEPQEVSFLYGEGTTYTQFGLTGLLELGEKLRLTANWLDYGGFLVERRNLYDGPTFSLGLALEY